MQKSKKKHQRLGQVKDSRWPLLLAFLIPFLGYVAVMVINGCEPFGNDAAFLYSDEYHQYYPFFVSFRNALRSGQSLLQNWQIGMGVDYLGLIAYYLGSPLNLLSVLVPESLTLELFAMLVPIRLGLAGLFFAIMLKKLYGKNDIALALFGSFYALCAWALGFQWNVMWLDTFALLPLVALGTIALLRDKKFILYTVSLFLSVAINYYIGLFTCIFVFLLFICYEICRFQGFKRLGLDLLRIAAFSALAIGMTAFVSLPTLVNLGNTNSTVNNFPQGFRLNIANGENYIYTRDAWKALEAAAENGTGFFGRVGLWFKAVAFSVPPILDGMAQVAGNMGGGARFNFKEGLPNVYSGVVVTIFAFLFLTSKKVKLRDKLCSVGLLIFFMLSFIIRQLDYIWHGFHFPNMIPYRFSFLFSFVVVWMGYRAWLLRNEFKLWQVIVAAGLMVGIMFCHNDWTHVTYICINGLFTALTVGLFVFILIDRKRTKKDFLEADKRTLVKLVRRRNRKVALLLALIMLGEVAANLVWFNIDFRTTSVSNYPKGTVNTAHAISYMKHRERNNLFYRTEVTHTQTYNDGALNNYNGITTFTSSANVHSTDFMKALGFGARRGFNRYAYEETSPVANLFLNLKYLIERDGDVEENSYLEELHHFGDVYLLENKAYLPLGFLAEPELADWVRTDGAYSFERQEKLFSLATGVEEELWHMIPKGCVDIYSEDVEITNADAENGRATYRSTDDGTLVYGYTMTHKGFLCIEVDSPERNDFKVYKKIDGAKTELFSQDISLEQMFSVCEVNPGDLIWVEFDIEEDENATLDVQAGILDPEVFRKGYDVLSASTLQLTKFTNTQVRGIVKCNRDGLLYTSIPHMGNWTAEVDGKPVDVVLVGDCMVAVNLTEGTHVVSFRYTNKAFITGLIVTILCVLIFAALIYFQHCQRNMNGKYQTGKKKSKSNTAHKEECEIDLTDEFPEDFFKKEEPPVDADAASSAEEETTNSETPPSETTQDTPPEDTTK